MSDGDEGPAAYVPNISTATGDFYQSYKRQLAETISAITNVGKEALASRNLGERDSAALQHGVTIIEGEQRELFLLLSKIINESNPSIFEETTVATITNLLNGVFLVAKHGGFTDSARKLALDAQAKAARDARASSLKRVKKTQNEIVQRHADSIGADLSRPAQTAKLIMDAVNDELALRKAKTVDHRTIQRWISRLKHK